MPGTDLESLPELDAATGDTAGRKIRISSPPPIVGVALLPPIVKFAAPSYRTTVTLF
ncbi:hypothetical protein [Parageobacillus toebii]|uniref:hypothetical protein n=1 Tax=Parageobacillus toebii TaxID=153151 RepID=UPI0014317B6E|nr:hypothetical protein [Parageobacillus toebii]